MQQPDGGRTRVVIEGVSPEIDGGRFPIKRKRGDIIPVEADIFADGHAVISAVLCWHKNTDVEWAEVPMEPMVNDKWRASFQVDEIGNYSYTITAWRDELKTWQRDMRKKIDSVQDVSVEFLEGAVLLDKAASQARGTDKKNLLQHAALLRSETASFMDKAALALGESLTALGNKYPDRECATTYHKELGVTVDSERAVFSTWYEVFPRSCSPVPGSHGTFKDCEQMLPYIAEMGFDVLYLPPIHPIGEAQRKGKNNSVTSKPGEPGTPWAIGSKDGGHKSIHPELGTLEDFRHLLSAAKGLGIDIALDIALQCSPDHPYVKEHPEWFRRRPDGTIQYAENPPKKYQDIFPLEFGCERWQELWEELRSIFVFWAEQGVRIFRVDNPHTKPFAFWEWLISSVKKDYPEAIFLAEAFTRPKIMYRLAKLGFSQSYTYFTWRTRKQELMDYFTELTQTSVKEFFRPNLWPNTPDILSDVLRDGGKPAFMIKLVLAATLGASYGIYGPAFELCENRRKDVESEEYLDSEKYELKQWNISDPNSLKDFIAHVNRIRKGSRSFNSNDSLRFHHIDNENIICYSKKARDSTEVFIIAVTLDCEQAQSGCVNLDLQALGIDEHKPFTVYDALNNAEYRWEGCRNYVELNPLKPAHIFCVSQQGVI